MKRLLVLLVALITLGTSSPAIAHVDPVADGIKNAVCRATQWDNCSKITPPIAVENTDIVQLVQRVYYPAAYLYGFYIPGTNYVFLRTDISKQRLHEVLVHESIHYYYFKTRNILKQDKCESEYLARYYTTKVLSSPYDSTWYKRYGCDKYRNAPRP